MKRLALVCACVLLFSAARCPAGESRNGAPAGSDPALTVPVSDIAEENAHWLELGVTPPKSGIVLPHPWSQPWSGRSMIVPISWFKQAFAEAAQHRKDKTPMQIDAAALRADLPILHAALEKSYSGWETAAKRGWDWEGWFRRWDSMLAGDGERTIPDTEAFAPWNAYEAFQIDSHSGPHVTSRDLIVSRSAMLQNASDSACTGLETADGKQYALDPGDPAQQPHAVMRWNGHALDTTGYIVYPSARGKAKSIVCGGHHIAVFPFQDDFVVPGQANAGTLASIAALSGDRKGLAVYNTPAPRIGYLRLAAFSEAGDEALRKLLPSLPVSAGHEKLLIVDMRGNDGGSAPVDALSRWIPIKQIDPRLTQVHKRSCLYPGLWFNLMQVLSLQVKAPVTAEFRQGAEEEMRGIGAPASPQCPVSFSTTRGKWNYNRHHFAAHWQGRRPRLLVLVDNGCASDCEAMTWLLAQLPGTVIAGGNTLGVIGFTQPGFLLLPHTRIVFQLATSRTVSYDDDRSVNGYGLDVDVALPDTSDGSRDSILALATQLITK